MAASPLFTIVRNATIFPAILDFHGRGYIHGIESVNTESDPIDFGIAQFGNSLVNVTLREEYRAQHWHEHRQLAGRYLYCGAVSSHFGHFMAQSIHRLWACAELQDTVDGIILLPDRPGSKGSPRLTEVLDIFGVDPGKVLFVDQLCVAEEVVVPALGASIGGKENTWYQEILSSLFKPSSYRKTYLPRALVVSRAQYRFFGRCAGFDYFIGALKREEYFEFRPERYSLRRQLEFIMSADTIVWEEGSACHLLDILPRLDCRSALVRRRPDYAAFDGIVTAKTNGAIYNNVRLLEGNVPPHNRMSVLNDAPELATWLRDHGFAELPNWSETDFANAEAIDVARFYLSDTVNRTASIEGLDGFFKQAKHIERDGDELRAEVSVEKFAGGDNILRWALDVPTTAGLAYDRGDIHVRGWLVPSKLRIDGNVTVRPNGGAAWHFPFAVPRPDVIKAIFKESAADHPLLTCGFDFRLTLESSPFTLLWTVGGREEILAKIYVFPRQFR